MYNYFKQVHIGNEMRVRIWGCSGAKGDSISTLKKAAVILRPFFV